MTTILESAQSIIAALDECYQQHIERFQTLATLIRQKIAKSSSAPPPESAMPTEQQWVAIARICLFLAPSLMGILRGLGRAYLPNDSGNNSSIVSALFPPLHQATVCESDKFYTGAADVLVCPKNPDFKAIAKFFPGYRSIVPQFLSHKLLQERKSTNETEKCGFHASTMDQLHN